MAMVIDNGTDYPFALSLFSDYGFEVFWNAGKGRKELVHMEYIDYLNGEVSQNRSRKIADVFSHTFSIKPFLDTKFAIKWVWHNIFYCLMWDGQTIVIRNTDIVEFV